MFEAGAQGGPQYAMGEDSVLGSRSSGPGGVPVQVAEPGDCLGSSWQREVNIGAGSHSLLAPFPKSTYRWGKGVNNPEDRALGHSGSFPH